MAKWDDAVPVRGYHPNEELNGLYRKFPAFKQLMESLPTLGNKVSELEADWADRILSAALSKIKQRVFKKYYYWKPVEGRPLLKYGRMPSWGDHHRCYKNEEGQLVHTVEPYTLEGKQLAELLEYAKDKGLGVRMSGQSQYFPGRTVMIVLFKLE